MINDQDEDAESANFVPTIFFMKAGVAKAVPDKVSIIKKYVEDWR